MKMMKELLSSITNNFLNKNKINLSRETVNLLTSRSNGKRENLYNELDKILNFSFSRKKFYTKMYKN